MGVRAVGSGQFRMVWKWITYAVIAPACARATSRLSQSRRTTAEATLSQHGEPGRRIAFVVTSWVATIYASTQTGGETVRLVTAITALSDVDRDRRTGRP